MQRGMQVCMGVYGCVCIYALVRMDQMKQEKDAHAERDAGECI